MLKNKEESRRHINVPLDRKVILFFGLIKKIKGLEVLLESLTTVKEKHPDILLLIAGKVWKNDFSVYQEIIAKYNLDNHCLLHTNFIPDKDEIPAKNLFCNKIKTIIIGRAAITEPDIIKSQRVSYISTNLASPIGKVR